MRRGEFFALLALGLALFADGLDFALRAVDDLIGKPAVDLDLFFAHAARRPAASSTARARRLTVKVAPHPRQAGKGVLHAGELDLEAGLFGLGALGENIEDDFLAVDHAEVGQLFPLALLRRSQPVVDHDHVALVGAGQLDELVGLPCAAEEFFVHLAAAIEHRLDHLDTERFHQFA